MGRTVLVAAVCALLACSSRAEAQCAELLKGGVFETTSFTSSSTSTQSFMNWLRSHHSELSTKDTGGGLSIPVIGSLNGSDKQYRDIESDYAASQSGSSSASQNLAAHIRSVSSALAAQFNDCMRIKGLHVWVETTDDPRIFKLAAVYNSPSDRALSRIDGVELSTPTASCGREISAGVKISGSPVRTFCRRATDEPVSLFVNAQDEPIGGGNLRLPRIPREERIRLPRCDSEALVSTRASASHPRLTDGIIGPNSPGQNSGQPGGKFWVELPKGEWIHRVVMHPFMNGTIGSNQIVGYFESGGSDEIAMFSTAAPSSAPISVNVNLNKSKNVNKIEVTTSPSDGRSWVAWTEIQIFACR